MNIKTRKITVSFMIVCILVSMQITQAFASSKTPMNSITPQPSDRPNWCWASVSAASGQYWLGINQYTVCNRTQYDACYHIYNDYNDHIGNIWDVANAMNYVAYDYGIADSITSPLDWSYVKTYINQNKPVPAGVYQPQLGTGHMLLVVGYDDNNSTVYYCDPYNGAKTGVNYTSFITANYGYRWVYSSLWGNYWNGRSW